MRSYTVKKICGAPDWNAIPVMPIDNLLWTDSIDITAQAQLCWDADYLYVRLEAWEKEIRMEETGALAEVCEDSCLEFFLQPTERPDYFNFEMNPNQAIWLGYGPDIENLVRLMVRGVAEMLDSKVEFTEGGWVLSYHIPFDFIRRFFPDFKAEEGTRMRANAYKCGDSTVKPHYLAWNPIDLPKPAFHCPQFFGELILGGK